MGFVITPIYSPSTSKGCIGITPTKTFLMNCGSIPNGIDNIVIIYEHLIVSKKNFTLFHTIEYISCGHFKNFEHLA